MEDHIFQWNCLQIFEESCTQTNKVWLPLSMLKSDKPSSCSFYQAFLYNGVKPGLLFDEVDIAIVMILVMIAMFDFYSFWSIFCLIARKIYMCWHHHAQHPQFHDKSFCHLWQLYSIFVLDVGLKSKWRYCCCPVFCLQENLGALFLLHQQCHPKLHSLKNVDMTLSMGDSLHWVLHW